MSTLKLTKPITAYGQEVTELVFAEPDGGSLIDHGMPYTISGDESIEINMKSVAGHISALAKIPKSSVRQMSWKDLQAAALLVVGFFGSETPAKLSTGSSTSATSGD